MVTPQQPSNSDDHLSHLLVSQLDGSWYPFFMSTGFQVAAVAMLFILGATNPGQKVVVQAVTLFMPAL